MNEAQFFLGMTALAAGAALFALGVIIYGDVKHSRATKETKR